MAAPLQVSSIGIVRMESAEPGGYIYIFPLLCVCVECIVLRLRTRLLVFVRVVETSVVAKGYIRTYNMQERPAKYQQSLSRTRVTCIYTYDCVVFS